jgi:hypothetical protein
LLLGPSVLGLESWEAERLKVEMKPEMAVSNKSSKDQNVIKHDIPPDSPPPKPEEIDQWRSHVKLREFREQLQTITDASFPNTTTSRYKNVYVLILKWEDEDPNLPVSFETSRLENVFRNVYHFQTEAWDIPDKDCHDKVNQKILDFKRQGGNSQNDLKIVYHGGHGKLTRNGSLAWTRYHTLFPPFRCP